MPIDDISEKIGELTIAVEMLRSQTKEQWDELKGIPELTAKVEAVQEDVSAMKPYVDDYRKLKQRGIGVLGVVGLMGGGLGAIGAWLTGLLGGGGGGGGG